MTKRILLPFLLALGMSQGAAAAESGGVTVAPAPDYAQPASWACRPGAETVCTTGLDAMRVDAQGNRTPVAFQPAADPKIDCFYVYPTTSREQTPYADMRPTEEVVRTVKGQAGRLTSVCRMFAPLYRQMTLAGLGQQMASGKPLDWEIPYKDVVAAWRHYLAKDNKGRGVVLVGHSQGTILLQRLIAEEIDGKPVQKRLVSAFLAGDPGLGIPSAGGLVGGTFKHVPICTAASQTGCVYPWGSYQVADQSRHIFGADKGPGIAADEKAACGNPAAPGGGSGTLIAYFPKPAAAADKDPPWVETVGQLSAACAADAGGQVLRVSILPGAYQNALGAALERSQSTPGWGLHRIDVHLVQGNMLEVIAAESAAWAR